MLTLQALANTIDVTTALTTYSFVVREGRDALLEDLDRMHSLLLGSKDNVESGSVWYFKLKVGSDTDRANSIVERITRKMLDNPQQFTYDFPLKEELQYNV